MAGVSGSWKAGASQLASEGPIGISHDDRKQNSQDTACYLPSHDMVKLVGKSAFPHFSRYETGSPTLHNAVLPPAEAGIGKLRVPSAKSIKFQKYFEAFVVVFVRYPPLFNSSAAQQLYSADKLMPGASVLY